MRTQKKNNGATSSLQELTADLAKSEARNEALLEAAVDSIVTINERGIIQSVNAATTKTFGYEASELLGQNVSILIPEPYRSEHDSYLERYAKTGIRRIIGIGREVKGKRKNGSTFPMDLSVSEVKLPGARFFTGILRDITYRKQVEEALLSERNRFSQYLEIAAVAIISLDANGKIQLMNRDAIALAKTQEVDALGKSPAEIFLDEPQFIEAIFLAIKSGARQSWETTFSIAGEKRVVAWHCSPLKDYNGSFSGTLLSGADITERTHAQELLAEAHHQLERRVHERTEALSKTNVELRGEIAERIATEQRLEASLKEKEVLLKEIHHRVKNNLQLISSILSLQMRSSKGMSTEQLVSEIKGRIQTIALLHEMLYQSDDLVHVDFAKYIESFAQTIVNYYGLTPRVKVHTAAKDIKLSLDTSIYCGLLFNELITNAVKHAFPSGRNGNLWVEARSVDQNRIKLIVRDDGVGLKNDFDINKISSLGLELVRQLTTKLRGELIITREGGTSFEIDFRVGG